MGDGNAQRSIDDIAREQTLRDADLHWSLAIIEQHERLMRSDSSAKRLVEELSYGLAACKYQQLRGEGRGAYAAEHPRYGYILTPDGARELRRLRSELFPTTQA